MRLRSDNHWGGVTVAPQAAAALILAVIVDAKGTPRLSTVHGTVLEEFLLTPNLMIRVEFEIVQSTVGKFDHPPHLLHRERGDPVIHNHVGDTTDVVLGKPRSRVESQQGGSVVDLLLPLIQMVRHNVVPVEVYLEI